MLGARMLRYDQENLRGLAYLEVLVLREQERKRERPRGNRQKSELDAIDNKLDKLGLVEESSKCSCRGGDLSSSASYISDSRV